MSVYDDFAKQWRAMHASGTNLAHELLEKPAMYAKIPDVSGQSVLCLGCGTGEECSEMLARGASRVVGVDNSVGMLEVARAEVPAAEFERMDMASLSFPDGTFDYVYSSLVMHYAREWTPILQSVRKIMRPGASFLFSTHHPVKWSASVDRGNTADTFMLGYVRPKDPKDIPLVYGDYRNTRAISDRWFGQFDVTYYHKPLSEIFQEIRDSGFQVLDFLEPGPVDSAKESHPAFWQIHSKIPMFAIFELMA